MAIEITAPRTPADREALFALRHEVFVVGQKVPPELERDAEDATADHVMAVDEGGVLVGTGRLVIEPDGAGRIGRMAVHAPVRGRGIGRLLLEALERIAAARKISRLHLHAQISAEPFYAKCGYVRAGALFQEAGIEHVDMAKRLR